jgi:hypothetical protein
VFRVVAAASGVPVNGLRSFHRKHAQFEHVTMAYLEERGDTERKLLTALELRKNTPMLLWFQHY